MAANRNRQASETTPLLDQVDAEADAGLLTRHFPSDPHAQFCLLTGVPPSDLRSQAKWPKPGRSTLYGRATRHYRAQNLTYNVTAVISNSLLLGQIMLGALVTALGASSSSHVLITLFGALNTVIAGLVAYLKSRGQPQRARMFRDDLERIVDELENSEVMWLGIAGSANGYKDLITDDVSVRSEVARLTMLYDHAVKTNTRNNPDNISGGNDKDQEAISSTNHRTVVAAAPGSKAVPALLESPMITKSKKDSEDDDDDDDKKDGDKKDGDKKDGDKKDKGDDKNGKQEAPAAGGSSEAAKAPATTASVSNAIKSKPDDEEEL